MKVETFEELKALIDNEDLLVKIDNQLVFEYSEKGEKSFSGEVYLTNDVYATSGSIIEIDEDSLSSVEVFKYSELDVTFENICKAIKSQNSDKTDFMVFEDWGDELQDIEEYFMENGVHNIEHILKVKRV